MSGFYSFPLYHPPDPSHSGRKTTSPGTGGTTDTDKPQSQPSVIECDVLIAGSGPIGATYARALFNAGLRVYMVDVGDQDTPEPAVHKKNAVGFQKNIDKFVHVIQGALDKVSIPASDVRVNTLDPLVWQADKPFNHNGINPAQDPGRNLGAQAVTRTVGGMSTHWTCATPRFRGEELPKLDADPGKNQALWDDLYEKAEKLIGTGHDQFDKSMRQQMILKKLKAEYKTTRDFSHLPLACTRVSPSYVNWHSAATVFNMKDQNITVDNKQGWFRLRPTHQCYQLYYGPENITQAKIRSFNPNSTAPPSEGDSRPSYTVTAQVFILAAGAVANPQILAKSTLVPYGPPKDMDASAEESKHIKNVGQYITEQTMAFCQTVFYQTVIDDAVNDKDADYQDRIESHKKRHPKDPLPIPWTDPEPQIIALYDDSEDLNRKKPYDDPEDPQKAKHPAKRPWHGQIHRDAFSYGAVAESIDNRLIVDFRWFGRTQPKKDNVLYFLQSYTDNFNMPQPTFDYVVPIGQTRYEANRMMNDMIDVASKIGGFLPGSNPQFMEPGLALHLGGTHRSGLTKEESAVDTNSKVWNYENLYLGGVGNIPTAFAHNPTLTAIAYAIRSSEAILKTHWPSVSATRWDLPSDLKVGYEKLDWEDKPQFQ